MGTQEFLVGLISAGGGGVALWGAMAFIIRLFPTMSSDWKFWLTMALAFVIPTGAYLALVALFSQPFAWEGFLLAVATGYQLSQLAHRGTEQIGTALNKQ